MNAIAQQRFGPAGALRSVATGSPALGPGVVAGRVRRATVSPHGSPVLRGAAYIAALEGHPWRPLA